jgi:uncharacterized protein (TIGR02147 family)
MLDLYQKLLRRRWRESIFAGMRSVVEFQDYREFMRHWFAENKLRHGLTWRDFSHRAGYVSPVFLKLVSEGKSSLRGTGADRVAQAMGLEGFEKAYFKSLVTYNQSKLGPARKKAYDEMQALAQAHKVNVLGKDSMGYYESWKNPVLRELVPHVPGMFPKKVADCCLPKLTASEVKESVRYLESLGLLVKNRDGSYSQSDKSVSTGEMSFVPLTIQQMHLQMGGFALDAIKNLPLSERNVSGITMGLTQKAYKKIVEELAEFRKKVVAIATEDDGMDRVYRLNLQLFPLTKNIQEM